ncbi:ABC transporter ATP-binding protein [Dyadobacter fanqingshengii]|uniref:ABC transporter ATP-binding protein/permease n=1 Tax=Dyadobacter fanqingshengii TaxID=2906443 RepID=A0A9X1PD09_9BACT|nr:ABC transporter ATP-binding protein [Dyadobacter fanqingshengii]MCF0040992.1 ABC transporter ATP-binding protein/permease [Dyadobacter fanqingshengii]MCF2505904.1 ABC transporter ATP-binding protein/permease [Dyadobacter fanqingshengii]USJ37277.1 ABC transporter ATP-binding protein/permease [Dyadobacter fanqingshengii]
MKLLIQYLSRYKALIFLALVLAAINQVFSLLNPYILGNYLIDPYANKAQYYRDNGLDDAFYKGVLMGLLMIIGVAMVSRIAKAFQDYVVNVVIQKFGASLYTDGLRHALRLPFQDFEDQRSGETLSVLQKVRADCEKFITSFVNVLFATLVGIVFVVIVAFKLSPSLPLIYLVGSVVLAILTSVLSRKIKVIQKNIVKETTALAGSTTESLRNIELVKSLGLTQQEISRLNTTTFKILKLELRKVKSIRSISFIQGTFVNFLQQCIMFALLFFVFKDRITVGQMMMMQFYSFFIFGPLQELGNVILSYREAEASLNNLQTLLARPVEHKPANPEVITEIEELRFDHVLFQHQSANRPALEDISFDVKRGETIAFVGPSGSGKTTLVKLLVGLYHPITGAVYYNGINGNSIDFDEIRNKIGFVTQDTQLFSGTIKENLLFVNPDATDEMINDVLLKAACYNLLSRAENGIDTVIGEGGLKLSGGERQRLSIARALLRVPHLIIFDEATSALDSLTEEEISNTIRNITDQRQHITVMIAHRLSTIMHADRIYVLEKGNIVETGSHHALLDEKGLYYAMWRQQIGERKDETVLS